MTESAPPERPRHGALTSLALGALVGALTSLLRSQWLLELATRGAARDEVALLRARVAQDLWADYPWSLGLGALAGLVAWTLLAGRRAHWWLSVPLASAASLASLAGIPWAADSARLDRLSSGDLMAHEELLLVSLLAGLALSALVAAAARGPARAPRGRGLALAALLLLLSGVPWAFGRYVGREAPQMVVRFVKREVALEPESWDVREARPDEAPSLGILTPSIDYRTDGGDLPSIVMPPPAHLRFTVGDEDGPVHLDFAAGVDDSVNAALPEGERLRVGFEVRVNQEPVFRRVIEAYRGKPMRETHWERPEPDLEGLDLVPGDVVSLRTAVLGKRGKNVVTKKPLKVGFGRVVLEKVEHRERLKASPEKPNIVLIVQDTMRADHSSLYDFEKPTTPALDALAARGITFREARSTSSWTWPSTASILTGLLPDEHGVTDDDACYLLGQNETLAEALQARGYTTAAFTCNPLISRQKNFDQGFETFFNGGASFLKTQDLIDRIRAWIRLNAGVRFFLYLHLVDPHAPYEPLPEHLAEVGEPEAPDFPGQAILQRYKQAALGGITFDKQGRQKPDPFPPGHIRELRGYYDASILTGDYYLAAVEEELAAAGLDDRTVIVFTSDHGEEWLEHGHLTHGQSVHRELVHVPLVMAGPGLPRGVESDVPVSNRHVAATLARIGGADLEGVEGALDLTRPEELSPLPVFFATRHGRWNERRGRQPIYGVREGRWVLHFAPEGTDFGVPRRLAQPGGQRKLYDLSTDPDETRDVADEHPDVAERLERLILDNLAQQLARQKGSVELGGGAATMQMLDGIGYLDDK